MKKQITLFLIIMMSVFLTGCVRLSVDVDIKTDGKADVTMTYAISDSMAEYGGDALISEDEVSEMQGEGWIVTEYHEDGFSGYSMVRKGADLEEIANNLQSVGGSDTGSDTGLSIRKEGLDYILDWGMLGSEQSSEISSYSGYFNMSGGYMRVVIHFPYKPSESNATIISEDGKTHTWDLLALTQGERIHVRFSMINLKLIVIIAAVAVVIIAAVVVLLLLIRRRKNKPNAGQYAGPDRVLDSQTQPMTKQQAIPPAHPLVGKWFKRGSTAPLMILNPDGTCVLTGAPGYWRVINGNQLQLSNGKGTTHTLVISSCSNGALSYTHGDNKDTLIKG